MIRNLPKQFTEKSYFPKRIVISQYSSGSFYSYPFGNSQKSEKDLEKRNQPLKSKIEKSITNDKKDSK